MSKSAHPNKDRTALLNELWAVQNKHGYISDHDIKVCAQKFKISYVQVAGVVSFYHFFQRKPSGKYQIYLNNSIVSEFKGYERVKEAFEKETGSKFGDENISGPFGLFETPCIGLSDQEPAAMINFHPFTNLHTLKVREIISKLKQGAEVATICDEVPDHIRYTPKEDKVVLLRDYYPGICLDKLNEACTPDDILSEIKKSKLSGMGGAFFPTGMKWEFCRNQKAATKYVVCNSDEGEPGTFKDRVLLNAYPGLLLEGMILCGYVIKSKQGIIYLRAEYTWLKNKLERTIEQFRRMGMLGKNISGIKGFSFDIRVQIGAGSYVCGEETALLNSLEGKRGEPRTKMYFPTERGFLNKPTVINNVETFCAAARIIELGADYYLNTGTPESPGTKLLSISGDCHLPGIYEIEWGTKIEEILTLCEADDPYFMQISGPSGQCYKIDEKHLVIAKNEVKCGGSFMIFNRQRDILKILQNFAEFFKHESCGVCTPCRAGNFIITRRLKKLELGLAYDQDFQDVLEWGKIMQVASRCGLGKTATNSLITALTKFSTDFQKNIDRSGIGLNQGFDMQSAIQEYEKFKS